MENIRTRKREKSDLADKERGREVLLGESARLKGAGVQQHK